MEEDNTILCFSASKPSPNSVRNCGMTNYHTIHASNIGADPLGKSVVQYNIAKKMPYPTLWSSLIANSRDIVLHPTNRIISH
jgi:hypothetical protein